MDHDVWQTASDQPNGRGRGIQPMRIGINLVLARDLPGPEWLRLAGPLAVTLLIADLSYRLVETPVRRGGVRALAGRLGLGPPVLAPTLLAGAAAVVTAVVLGTTAHLPAGPPLTRADGGMPSAGSAAGRENRSPRVAARGRENGRLDAAAARGGSRAPARQAAVSR